MFLFLLVYLFTCLFLSHYICFYQLVIIVCCWYPVLRCILCAWSHEVIPNSNLYWRPTEEVTHKASLEVAPRGGYSQKNWVGVCGPLLKTLTLFMTKICDIPYPIYDMTKNSKPNLWPIPHIKIMFQTCIITSSVVQTNFILL